jgi:hypothetical protein
VLAITATASHLAGSSVAKPASSRTPPTNWLRGLKPFSFIEGTGRLPIGLWSNIAVPSFLPPVTYRIPSTDFLLAPQGLVITCKLARPDLREPQLAEQFREDTAYHREQRHGTSLIGFVLDPQGLLHEPAVLEGAWASREDDFDVRCVISVG